MGTTLPHLEEEEGTEDWNGDRPEIGRGTTNHKSLRPPKAMMFLIGIQSRSGYKENGMRRWSF